MIGGGRGIRISGTVFHAAVFKFSGSSRHPAIPITCGCAPAPNSTRRYLIWQSRDTLTDSSSLAAICVCRRCELSRLTWDGRKARSRRICAPEVLWGDAAAGAIGPRSLTTSDGCQIDVRRRKRAARLSAGQCFTQQWTRHSEVGAAIRVRTETDQVIFSYRYCRYQDSCADLEYAVHFERTQCHYGGTRAWFLCPAAGCGRRVAILYLHGAHFACRKCSQLPYQSQRETPHFRAIRRAQAIRAKLGGSANLSEPFPWKPDRMRWSTYSRLRRQAEEAESRSWPNWMLKRASV